MSQFNSNESSFGENGKWSRTRVRAMALAVLAAVGKAIRSCLPLSERETDTLFCRVNDTIHATLYGMVALSALQGVLGGLMFWWLGVPSPWFWALVAAVFAFVPVVDTLKTTAKISPALRN